MESMEAIVRLILARIRVHQIPRHVPTVDELRLTPRKSDRSLYRVTSTAWGLTAREGLHRTRGGSEEASPCQSGASHSGVALGTRKPRLPRAHPWPAPRGLLSCRTPEVRVS